MLARLKSDERGFTMVTVIGALLVVTLLAVGGLSYAQNDLPVGADDRDRKIAYAAAEAGAQNYLYYLSQDPDYWSQCDTGTTPAQINQRWNGSGADPRQFVRVPDTTNAWYTIELLPANGASACDTANADATMIDAATGTFRIRVTGRAGTNGKRRSIVVNHTRKSLLEYVYLTDKETLSPLVYPALVANLPTRTPKNCTGAACRDLKTWAMQECDRYYGENPEGAGGGPTDGHRQDQNFNGEIQLNGEWRDLNEPCTTIYFIDADNVTGPFHTNDEFICNGSPDFGSSSTDEIGTTSSGQPVAPPAAGYRGGGCTPNFIGTHTKNAGRVEIPPTNGKLYEETSANYRFVGRTQITLNGANMTVIGKREDGTTLASPGVTMPIPAGGVVSASTSAAGCPGYNAQDPYTAANDGCGNLEVKGNYSVNVTFSADDDIIVMDDLTRPAGNPPSPDVLLGLIAENFIRVYHPVTCGPYGCNQVTGCTNNGGPGSITIDAAILSLNHSFIVDNYYCGANLGTLTVRGAIAQKFRGTVGRGSSGYTKAYSYDRRLLYRSPPKFLEPVRAAWKIQTYNEQVPAR